MTDNWVFFIKIICIISIRDTYALWSRFLPNVQGTRYRNGNRKLLRELRIKRS